MRLCNNFQDQKAEQTRAEHQDKKRKRTRTTFKTVVTAQQVAQLAQRQN